MTGLVHLVSNVAQGVSQIALGPLAAVAAIVPGLAPAVSALSTVTAIARGSIGSLIAAATGSPLVAAVVNPPQTVSGWLGALRGIIPGGATVANGNGGTDLSATDSEHSLGLGYTPPYSDIQPGPIPGSDVLSTIGSGISQVVQSVTGLLHGAGSGASATDPSATAATLGQGLGVGAMIARAIPAIEAVIPKFVLRAAGAAGIAAAAYELYKNLRAQGMSHKSAKRTALRAAGIHVRRRRMRATNIHALRRAMRRVHAFQKIGRKVGLLRGARRVAVYAPRRRRRYRRGDVSPFGGNPFELEDRADQLDEAEDYDLDLEPAYE